MSRGKCLRILCLAWVVAWAPALAHAGSLDQGTMSFGVSGGGGPGTFSIGGSFGYFVVDNIRPGLSMVYVYQDTGAATSNQVDTTLSLRAYFLDEQSFHPFVEVSGGHNHLSFESDLFSRSYNFFHAGAGAGVQVMLNRHFGVEVMVGTVHYLGVPQELTDADAVPEGFAFTWGFGFVASF